MADCAHCGQSVQEADNFCIKCGHPVEKKVSGSIDDVLDVVKPGQDEQPGRSLRVGDESTSVNMGDVYVQRGGPSDEHARYCRSCGNFVAQDVSYRCPQCGVFPLCWKHFNEQDRVCAVCSPNAFTQGGSPGSTTGISGATRSLGTTSAPTETASQAPTPVPSPAPQGIAPPPALTGVLERSIAGFNTLPLVVQSEVGNLSLIRQEQFADEYRRKRKSLPLAYLLWFILAAHYVYLGRWPMTLFLWVTLFFTVGIIWWVVDIFRMPGMVGWKKTTRGKISSWKMSLLQLMLLGFVVITLYEVLWSFTVLNAKISAGIVNGLVPDIDRLTVAYPDPDRPWNLIFSTKVFLMGLIISAHAFYLSTRQRKGLDDAEA